MHLHPSEMVLVLIVKLAEEDYQREPSTDYQRPEGYHASIRAE